MLLVLLILAESERPELLGWLDWKYVLEIDTDLSTMRLQIEMIFNFFGIRRNENKFQNDLSCPIAFKICRVF